MLGETGKFRIVQEVFHSFKQVFASHFKKVRNSFVDHRTEQAEQQVDKDYANRDLERIRAKHSKFLPERG